MDLNLPQTNKAPLLGYGFGKTILLGEHFVVYGLPALVTALDFTTTATIEPLSDPIFILVDERFKVPGFKSTKQSAYEEMAMLVFKQMGIDPVGWKVVLQGLLPVTGGGIGASAAAAVAIARSVNLFFDGRRSDAEINAIAWRGEQIIHGTPSGIDNAAATFGGTFVYQLGPEQFSFSRTSIHFSRPLYLVLADSGRSTNIKQILEVISAFKNQHVSAMTHFFQRYSDLFSKGLDALNTNDEVAFGQAMTANHALLQEFGVSCPELDFMVKQALLAGALGAKLTGTGCGGLMVALTDSSISQNIVLNKLNDLGFFAIGIKINVLAKPKHFSSDCCV